MKILFLNHNLIWRGTFFRCLGFARELVKQGHEVDLWTVAKEKILQGERQEIDGVRVWITPRWSEVGKHDGGYAFVDNMIRLAVSTGNRWDVVHAFDHRPNVLLPWLWLKMQNRLLQKSTLFVSDWCDWWAAGGITTGRRPFAWIDKIENRIEEGSKRISDGVTVISSVLYERARQAGVAEKNLLLLPSGADVSRFPLLDRAECRRRLNLPGEAKILGFVGFSLWDLELLADAFAEIRRHEQNAVLLVIGGGVEEEAKNIFRRRFEIGREVFLPGVVPFHDVPTYLGACDIHLLPMKDNRANQARFPNKLTDYYASGRPVVVSDVGDAAQLVHEHQTGRVGGLDAATFAQAVLKLLHDEALALDCGRRARNEAENRFSFSNLSQSLLQFYLQLEPFRGVPPQARK